MKLGKRGVQWVEEISHLYTGAESLCTTWQQEFFESFWKKADDFGEGAFITDKQLSQLNKIADIYGLPWFKVSDFDQD